jgi:hypothetical protein
VADWRHGRHLVERFFGHLSASALSPAEQQLVADRLDEHGTALFFAQGVADQRHAFDVAELVAETLPGDDEVYVAALLHDVGKRHSRLGALGRTVATILDGVGAPMTARMRWYRRHGMAGAADLASAGYDGLVVAFAANHPGPRPEGVDPVAWDALVAADEGHVT